MNPALWTGLLIVIFFGIGPAYGDLLRVESETLSTLRRGEDLNLHFPVYEFLQTRFQTDQETLDINSDFAFSGDPLDSTYHFDLYVLDLKYQLIKQRLDLRVGRSFDVQHGVGATHADSVALDSYFLSRRLRMGAFAGVERELAFSNWKTKSQIAGVSTRFQTHGIAPLVTGARYMLRHYSDSNKTDNHLMQVFFQKPFHMKWSPELSSSMEYYLENGKLREWDTVLAVYPTMNSYVEFHGITHDENQNDGVEDPLFKIFSLGRLYEFGVKVGGQISPHIFPSVSVSYDDYLLQQSQRAHGYRATVQVLWDLNPWTIQPGIYAFKSMGGWVVGTTFSLQQNITKRFELMEVLEATYYNKITSSKNVALSSSVKLRHWLSEHLKFELGAEANSNNVVKADLRVMAKLVYWLWEDV